MTTVRRRRALAAVGIGAAAVLALPPSAGAASALEVSDGRVSAAGAAVRVPVEFRCTKGNVGFVTVSLTQAIGSRSLASGSGGRTIACSGKSQKRSLYVQASPSENGRAFRSGYASATVALQASDPNQCQPVYSPACAADPGLARRPSAPPSGLAVPTSATVASKSDVRQIDRTIAIKRG